VGSIWSSLYATQLSDGIPAREAFVHAMSRASIVVAIVAALGALIAWRYLPARGVEHHREANASAAMDGGAQGSLV
jgi:uncharacterized membrane protein YozB (DUF420 family)